jgi:Aminotransferase class-III
MPSSSSLPSGVLSSISSLPTQHLKSPLSSTTIRTHYDAYEDPQDFAARAGRGLSRRQQEMIAEEYRYGAHNYQPIPVVLSKGEGVHVYDVDGRRFLDFLSAYSAVNQGHCHPRIVQALMHQAQRLTLTSRAFYNDQLGHFCKFMTTTFGYERMLPMNVNTQQTSQQQLSLLPSPVTALTCCPLLVSIAIPI